MYLLCDLCTFFLPHHHCHHLRPDNRHAAAAKQSRVGGERGKKPRPRGRPRAEDVRGEEAGGRGGGAALRGGAGGGGGEWDALQIVTSSWSIGYHPRTATATATANGFTPAILSGGYYVDGRAPLGGTLSI